MMTKTTLKQANFRLPAELLEDLKTVAEAGNASQSEIARKGIAEKVQRLKTRRLKAEVAAK